MCRLLYSNLVEHTTDKIRIYIFRSDRSTISMNSQGFLGPIAQNETFFYALDTIPLFIAIFNVCGQSFGLDDSS